VVGPPYQVVQRLIGIAGSYWAEIDGQCAASGFDPLDLPPDRFFNFIYYWAVNRVEDRQKFEHELLAPLPGRKRKPISEAEMATEGADFMAFMGTMA
jgi:hypothetical protein